MSEKVVDELNKKFYTSQTIDEFVRSKKLSGKWTKKTEAFYTLHLESFRKIAPGYLDEISKGIIEVHLEKVEAGKKGKPAPYMKRGAYVAIKTFLKWCVDHEFIDKSPMQHLEIGKPDVRIRRLPSKDDLQIILNYLRQDKSFLAKRNYAAILFMANSGVRLSEAFSDKSNGRHGIRDNDIDWNTGHIKVFGKGRRERTVGVQKNTLEAMHVYNLMAWKRWPAKKTLSFWLTEEGRPLAGGGFREAFGRIFKKLDFPYSPHDWRRFFCTSIAESGMNDMQGMALTGHRSHEMYERYNRSFNIKTALNELEKHSPVAGL
jgi:integrase/recombinase XerD